MNNTNPELPITALCIVTDKSKCPHNYTPIFKSQDTNTETDLWRDGIFGRKINRFICYTKDYPIADVFSRFWLCGFEQMNTYNVIEDVKLLNERDTLNGFVPIEKCLDTSEKAFQKKVLFIKVAHRFFTNTAVSDIILLAKTKRPPPGYSFIGEINYHSVCIRYSHVPSAQNSGPPPVPPRPANFLVSNNGVDQDGFVHIVSSAYQNNNEFKFNGTQNSISDSQRPIHSTSHQTHSTFAYNPLHGIPFEINPAYNLDKASNSRDDFAERVDRKLNSFYSVLERMEYSFKLEKSCVNSS